ncbi:serine protease [Candidatus Roizmanbacteria bacterium]|nr:serine protease [Candidatus Roizmanbacteria bacterium]
MKHKKTFLLFFISLLIILLLSIIVVFQTTNSLNKYSFDTKASPRISPYRLRPKAIIGGQDAYAGEFPFMVSIYYKPLFSTKKPNLYEQHLCGGVLIDKNWVLTAAHCFDYYGKSNIGVAFNVLKLTDEVDNDNLRSVSKLIIHKDYKPKFNEINPNDIALIKLNKSFTTFLPISINKNDISLFNKNGTILGWGYKTSDSKSKSDILQKADITYDYYSDTKNLTSNTPAKPYSYDSGGPLISRLNGTAYAVGVINQTFEKSNDSFYANISSYESWIEEKTGLSF